MKVLVINGSPNEEGCTFTALNEVMKELHKNDIETKTIHVGKKAIHGCIACKKCFETGKCVFNDSVNEILDMMKYIDGLLIGSPVYYSGANGSLVSLLNRLFYAGTSKFAYKPGAAVLSARRAGTTSTLDILNKYFSISNMPIVSSQYWNMVHGNTPEEVKQDLEGMQIMRMLGKNMAWLLKCIEMGKEKGVSFPEKESRIATNFIR